MKRVLWTAIAVSLLLSAQLGHAQAVGPYSKRDLLEQEVAKGSTNGAEWSLSWLYLEEGRLDKAYEWARYGSTGVDADRVYLKVWLAWRLGYNKAAIKWIDASQCASERCVRIKIAALIAEGDIETARESAEGWWLTLNSPNAFTWMLSLDLLAGRFEVFDHFIALVDWRADARYKNNRAGIMALVKLRANF